MIYQKFFGGVWVWVGGGTESEWINRGSKSIRYVSSDTFVNVTCSDSDLSFNLCNQIYFVNLHCLELSIYLLKTFILLFTEITHPAAHITESYYSSYVCWVISKYCNQIGQSSGQGANMSKIYVMPIPILI